LPPPTCTPPIELDALLPPLPPMLVGALTPAVFPATVAEADGVDVAGLVCTAPTESEAELPPPACTVPTEFVDVLSPDPVTEVGAATVVEDDPGRVALAVGSTVVLPT